jgi:hypothetical protein
MELACFAAADSPDLSGRSRGVAHARAGGRATREARRAGGAERAHEERVGSGQADRVSYAVQVQDEDGESTVRASEPAVPDGFLELTSYLRTLPCSREEIVPVGDLPTR